MPDAAADLSIAELVRVLDVASEVRRKQAVLDREWNREAAREELRETLLTSATASGESLTDEQVTAAIDWYYNRLHRFRPPPKGLKTAFAHLYVRRRKVLFWLLVFAAAVLLIWFLLFHGGAAEPR